MNRSRYVRAVITLLLGTIMAAVVAACGSTETVTVVETVIVTEKGDTVEVIKEVKGDTVEVIKEVKGDTVTVVATPTSAPTESAPDLQSGNDTVELVASNQVGLTN